MTRALKREASAVERGESVGWGGQICEPGGGPNENPPKTASLTSNMQLSKSGLGGREV